MMFDRYKFGARPQDAIGGSILYKKVATTAVGEESEESRASAKDDDVGLDASSSSRATRAETRSTLRILPFAVIVFYNVSGGPFGIEPSVRAGGAAAALLGFVFGPVVWAVPDALVTAELGSAFPHPSGGVAWVDEAFGPTAASIVGWMSWVSGATDNAIYPALFMDYLTQAAAGTAAAAADDDDGAIDDETNQIRRVACLVGSATVLTFVNWLGLEVVGNVSVAVALVSMSPFVYMCVVGVFEIRPERWWITTDEPGTTNPVKWGLLLNNLFWNLNSFDAAASFSQEVGDARTVYVRGIKVALVMVVLAYLLPLAVALGADDTRREDWVDGYFTTAAAAIGGEWLGDWVVLASAVSNVGLFMAELSADSFQLMGMAERGLLPRIFAVRSQFGTPTVGVLACYVVIACLCTHDVTSLVELMNVNHAFKLLSQYAAFLALRIKRDDVPRPYRVPLSTFGCVLFLLPATVATLAVVVTMSYDTYLFSACSLLVGVLLRLAQSRSTGVGGGGDDYDGQRRRGVSARASFGDVDGFGAYDHHDRRTPLATAAFT